jgi:hypothetical protein
VAGSVMARAVLPDAPLTVPLLPIIPKGLDALRRHAELHLRTQCLLHRHVSLRTGMIPPQLSGSPSYLRPGTPALAVFLHDLGYTTGEFGKNHLGDHTEALPGSIVS